MFLDDIVSPLNELSKDQLKNYIRANAADAVQRTSSNSFKSGAAGDQYNKSEFDTPVDRKRERGMDRALNKLAREDAFHSDEVGNSWSAGTGQWSSGDNQISSGNNPMGFGESETRLAVGDPVVVTAPNEFEGKTGEISELSPSGKFVIVDLYNYGKHSMHLSDIEYNQYADEEDDLDEDANTAFRNKIRDALWYAYQNDPMMPPESHEHSPEDMDEEEYQWFEENVDEILAFAVKNNITNANLAVAKFDNKHSPHLAHLDTVHEGWSNKMVAQRTGQAPTPYSVYIKGKEWKSFADDDHAENVADKLRARFKQEGRDPSAITIAPTGYDKGVAEGQWNYPKSMTTIPKFDKEADDYLGLHQGAKFAKKNKDDRKEWRKTQKAQAHKELMTGKKEQGVAEGFDQPYPLKWEKSDYGDMDALAKLPDGSPLSIMFNLADMSENDWGVEFYRNNSQSVTGEGDAYRVFATVLNAISQFIKKKKPDTLFFTAVKEEDPTGSRAKLYDRLVQKYATGLGYDLKKVDYPEQTGYKLTRKEQGVAEAELDEKWSQKYKSSINCSHPKGFSQRAHCAGKKKHNESMEMETVCEDADQWELHIVDQWEDDDPESYGKMDEYAFDVLHNGKSVGRARANNYFANLYVALDNGKNIELTHREHENHPLMKEYERLVWGLDEGQDLDEACWKGYHKEGMKTMFGKRYPNCVKNKNESLETYVRNGECPGCGGAMVAEGQLNEKQDACYHKVKSRYKVWPSAYASGALVQCREKGAANWGNSNESITQEEYDQLDENLKDWFGKEKWVRMDTKGNIKGPCARGSKSEGKPKCLPQAKAHALGKKGRASAAQKKRRQDPNPERRGKAINVSTRVKESYWNKLQYDRNTKIASLVNELEESIKDIK